jgi:penicillin-binding protein 1B
VRSPGSLTAAVLEDRLQRSGYVAVPGSPAGPGEYASAGPRWEVHLRAFDSAGVRLPERRVRFEFATGGLSTLSDVSGRRLDAVDLEPVLLARVFGARQEERVLVSLRDVPEGFVHAVLAAEDARFYSHPGFDPLAILRASFANLRSGRIVQGGSTITQQTVKNLYLGQERTFRRKLREVAMSVLLDLRYPKDRILEAYLNEVYLGQRGPVAICGSEAAALHFFGRSLRDLGPAEWATLAGLIRNPGGYNPFRHPERARERRGQVLDAMVERGWLEPGAAEGAKRKPMRLAERGPESFRAPYAVDWVRSELARTIDVRRLSREGIDVRTSLDPTLQEAAEVALARGLDRLGSRRRDARLEGAVVALDPRDGSVLAMVGGRDYRESQFNRAVQARRQPGSCFKPFVFLAGLEALVDGDARGITPATLLDDEPLEIRSGGKVWGPENYDREFLGPIPARRALEESRNVPTARLALAIGLDRVVEAAARCGIESDLTSLPSLALGAQEVTPLELARAYATIASGGASRPVRIVRDLSPASGGRTEAAPPATRSLSPGVAYVLTDMLRGVLDRGTAASARALGFAQDAAGKTGTTDDERDAWFVGFTPDILVLVWVGFDDGARTGFTGASAALPIWVDVMQRARYRVSDAGFEMPADVVRASVDPASGGLAASGCPESVEEVFVAGTEPTEPCPLHGRRLMRWFRRLFGRGD